MVDAPDELRHGRDARGAGVEPLDVLVEPLQHERVDVGYAIGRQAGARRDVGPGADQQPGVGVVGERLVEEGLTTLEQVVEATDDEGGDLDPIGELDG